MNIQEIKALAYKESKLKILSIPQSLKLYQVQFFTAMYYAYQLPQDRQDEAKKITEELEHRYRIEEIHFKAQEYTGNYFNQLNTIINKCIVNRNNCEICGMIADWIERT